MVIISREIIFCFDAKFFLNICNFCTCIDLKNRNFVIANAQWERLAFVISVEVVKEKGPS